MIRQRLKTTLCSLFYVGLVIITGSAEARTYVPEEYRSGDSNGPVELDWLVGRTAKETDVSCFHTSILSEEELLEKIRSYRSNTLVSRVVDGVEFVNADSALLRALEVLLVRQEPSADQILPLILGPKVKNQIDIVATAQLLFGKKIGLQLLYLFLHHRVNGSHFQLNESSPWEENELDSILLTFADLPRHLQKLPLTGYEKFTGYQLMVHAPRNKALLSDEMPILADSGLTFYDAWSDTDAFNRRTSAFHEVGHNIQFVMTDPQPLINLSPWPKSLSHSQIINGKVTAKTSEFPTTYAEKNVEPFVSQYSKTSPSEDFAESFTAYRYAPQWLRERNPAKYQYMKTVVFDGIEYLNESICRVENESPSIRTKKTITVEFDRFDAMLAAGKDLVDTNAEAMQMQRTCDLGFARDILLFTTQSVHSIHTNCTRRVLEKRFTDLTDQILGVPYASNIRDLRRADGSNAAFTPKLSDPAAQSAAKVALTNIRAALLVDMSKYLNAEGRKFQTCSIFATHFLNWAYSQGKESALVDRGTFARPSDTTAFFEVIQATCKPSARDRSAIGRTGAENSITLSDFRAGLSRTWDRVSPSQ